jgi:hypothetical protein
MENTLGKYLSIESQRNARSTARLEVSVTFLRQAMSFANWIESEDEENFYVREMSSKCSMINEVHGVQAGQGAILETL